MIMSLSIYIHGIGLVLSYLSSQQCIPFKCGIKTKWSPPIVKLNGYKYQATRSDVSIFDLYPRWWLHFVQCENCNYRAAILLSVYISRGNIRESRENILLFAPCDVHVCEIPPRGWTTPPPPSDKHGPRATYPCWVSPPPCLRVLPTA